MIGGGHDDDDVPPPIIIPIEDRAGLVSPYSHIGVDFGSRPQDVAALRLVAHMIGKEDGKAALVGDTISSFALVTEDLAETSGYVRLRRLEFVESVDIELVTAGATEEGLVGYSSKEMRAAERLAMILSAPDTEAVRKQLLHRVDDLLKHLEAFLSVLFENNATLHLQTPRAKPIRVDPNRAFSLYTAIRDTSHLPTQHFVRAAHLVGAYFDTHDFKLRLEEPWRNKTVIEGKFVPGLAKELEEFVNRPVLATVAVEEDRSPVKRSSYTFTLEAVRGPQAHEPMRLPET